MQSFSAINAKIGAMRASLLTEDDFLELSKMKDVDDISKGLAQTVPYRSSMANAVGVLRRSDIEKRLMFSLAEDFSSILRFINDMNVKRYLMAFFLRIDIRIIKTMLSSIYDERHTAYTGDELKLLLGHELNIDFSKLAASKTLSEFIENTKGSIFFTTLSNAHDEKNSILNLETALDLFYYLRIWKIAKNKMDRINGAILRQINGTEIDILNIIFLYRLKTFYNTEPSAIYSYLIPINFRVSDKKIARMANSKSHEELKNEIFDTAYGNLFEKKLPDSPDDIKKDIYGIEGVHYIAMKKIYRHMAARSPNSIAKAAEYIFDKEIEIKNIISVLEGVRYRHPSDEIMETLMK